MPEYKDAAERFKSDTAKHEMTVLHDDGLYRHLRFRAPDTGFYWFDLVTWPGNLAITGDMNGYVFSRVEDMFGFFRQSSWKGGINPTYWDEKVVVGRDSVMAYSEDLFNKQVTDDLKTAEEHYPGVTEAWNEKVNGFLAEYYTTTEHEARAALNDFEYLPEGEKGEPFRFQDTWEWQLRDYHWSFLWCCHAIVWGIGQYDKFFTDPIERLDFSGRIHNGLKRAGVHTVGDLIALSEQDVLDIPQFRMVALAEVRSVLKAHALELRS